MIIARPEAQASSAQSSSTPRAPRIADIITLFEHVVGNIGSAPVLTFMSDDIIDLAANDFDRVQASASPVFGRLEVDFLGMMAEEANAVTAVLDYYRGKVSSLPQDAAAGDAAVAAVILAQAAATLGRRIGDLGRGIETANRLFADILARLGERRRSGVAVTADEIRLVLAPVKATLDRMQQEVQALRAEMAAAIAAARHAAAARAPILTLSALPSAS